MKKTLFIGLFLVFVSCFFLLRNKSITSISPLILKNNLTAQSIEIFDFFSFKKIIQRAFEVVLPSPSVLEEGSESLKGVETTIPPSSNPSKQCLVYSDTSHIVKSTGLSAKKVSGIHTDWAVPISEAVWIWRTPVVEDAVNETTETFEKNFILGETPTSARIQIAVDDGFIIKVNGATVVDKITTVNNHQTPQSFDILSQLKEGENKISITVRNQYFYQGTAEYNPAGLMYVLTIEGAECGTIVNKQQTLEAVQGVIDDTAAKTLIGYIQNQCNINLGTYVDVRKDETLPFSSYTIRGSQIRYNGDRDNNTAVYAIARLSEDLLGAKMLWPSGDSIICSESTPQSDEIKRKLTTYSVTWRSQYYTIMFFNQSTRGDEALWFQWHHISTAGHPAGIHTSGFRGLAKKYPYLNRYITPTTVVTDTKKIDLLHPDVPGILYEKWVADGKPKIVNLFEIDGTDFPYRYKFPLPSGLNRYEQETFGDTIAAATPIRFDTVNGKFQGKCKKYDDGENSCITKYYADNIGKWLHFYMAANRPDSRGRLVLTPFYIEAYKNIEKYFIQKGVTDVRYMIFAYSAYYYMPPDLQVDLSNFDVYYTSPGSSSWNRSDMENDIANYNRWKKTGAIMIWRPNLWFANRFDPYFNFNLHNEFVSRVKPDGFMVTGYTPGAIPAAHGINYYTLFRTLQGRTPQEALNDYISAFAPQNQPVVRQYITTAESISALQTGFTNAQIRQLDQIAQAGTTDKTMTLFRKGVELVKKKNDFQAKSISKEQFLEWFIAESTKFPGMGSVGRFRNSLEGVGPAQEF